MLDSGNEREDELEYDYADEKWASSGYVSGNGARIDTENGDVGEGGVSGETPLEFPAVRQVLDSHIMHTQQRKW